MNTYTYVLAVQKGKEKPTLQLGTVSCNNFGEAVEMVLDTESMPWDEKRAQREIISITRIAP